MKQKIVVKVHICCDKCRTKALKIAATAEGVTSVTIQGNDKDEIMVVGVGVDSAVLCTALRKKLGHADLKSVEEIKDPNPGGKNKEGKKSEENKNPGKEEKKQNGNETKDGKERERAEAVIIHHHYPYPNCNCYQCYIHTTHYEDNPICVIL